jgi:dihydroorotate dehydrogenase electron transfer subunit
LETPRFRCKILSKTYRRENTADCVIASPEIAASARPGQFLHLQCGDGTAFPLRRPISICGADAAKGTVRFIFDVKGRGTAALALSDETEADVLGPLGNPFHLDANAFKNPAVIGGGIGAYPLLFLAKRLENPTAYLGFRTKALIDLADEFEAAGAGVKIATDDGSFGHKGFSADLLAQALSEGKHDIVYACGPLPMLKTVKALTERFGVKCQLSMEQRMGCGVGACLVCACETRSTGYWKYKRVCKNGPVFWADELVL